MKGDIRIVKGEIETLPNARKYLSDKPKKFRTTYILLKKLLASEQFNQLFRDFYHMVGVPVAIIDLNVNVMASSQW